VAAAVAAVVVVSALAGEGDSAYDGRIAAHRRRAWLRLSGADSPLSADARSALRPLEHYPADPAWRVPARLVPAAGARVALETSGGAAEEYLEHAWAELVLGGRAARLLLLKQPGDASNRLLLAFRDRTSGGETYGGGRYIDLYPQAADSVEIDFNLAYNPYCVYDPAYLCPLPPPENTLEVAVRAGEKMYRGAGPR
jgi:uncharacterized protein (DUF1684 family)